VLIQIWLLNYISPSKQYSILFCIPPLSLVDPTTTRAEPASWHPLVHRLAIIYLSHGHEIASKKTLWTVWSLTLQWWFESHGYIVVQWYVRIYTSRTEIARRRRKCARIRFETGINNTDKYILHSIMRLSSKWAI